MLEVDNTSRILYHFLRVLHVKVSKMTVHRLLDNPLGNSMRGISDALDTLHINNAVYQLPTEYFDKLESPFIAVTNDNDSPFCLVEKIEKKHVIITIPHTRHMRVSKQQLLQKWTGGVLVGEITEKTIQEKNYRLKNIGEWISQYQLLLAGIVAIFLILYHASRNYSSGMTLYLLTLCAGILISAAILYKETINHQFLHRFCHIGKVIDCNEVLHSKGSRIIGVGLGELSLFYFSTLLLFCLLRPYDFFYISALCSIIAIGFTIYSVLYQVFIMHKGCMLCIIINLVIWGSCLILYTLQEQFNRKFSLPTMFSFIAIDSICLIGWLQIQKLLKFKKEEKQLKVQLANLLNPDKFQKLLLGEIQIGEMVNKEIALHNQISSKTQLMIVTNPNCKNCAKIHSYIKEINSNISISLIFLTFPKDRVGEKVAKAIIATYRTNGWEKAMIALEEWYKNQKINKIDNYVVTVEEQRIWEQQQIYCSQQHISQTPSIIVDGYYVPEFYQLKELKYVLT